jgi:hypothetical protein
MKRSDLTRPCGLAAIFLCLATGIDIPISAAQGVDRPTQRSGVITKSDNNKTSAAAQKRPTTVASAALIAETAKQMNLQLGETFCTLTPRQLFVAGKGYLQFVQSNVDPESNEALLNHAVGLRIFLKPGGYTPTPRYLLACTVKKNEPGTFDFRDEPYEWKKIETIVDATSNYSYLFFVARGVENLIILRGSQGFHFYSCVVTNLK